MARRLKEIVSGFLGREPSFEERYQQALAERQREMGELLRRVGRLTQVDPTLGEELLFQSRLQTPEGEIDRDAADKLADALECLGKGLAGKNKAQLWEGAVRMRAVCI